jgi:phospholipid transport system transporter-binding protein
MSHPQWIELTGQSIQLQGELDRDSVPSLWAFAQTWYPQAVQVELSLKEVKRVDSAGMVMLIHLLEHAKKRNCHIMLRFVPKQLRTLFQLSNIETMVAPHLTD